jgi:hypothetical protein
MARTRRLLGRRLGPIGIALTAWDIWRRLPPEYKRQIVKTTRKHGPRIAKGAARAYRSYRRVRKR